MLCMRRYSAQSRTVGFLCEEKGLSCLPGSLASDGTLVLLKVHVILAAKTSSAGLYQLDLGSLHFHVTSFLCGSLVLYTFSLYFFGNLPFGSASSKCKKPLILKAEFTTNNHLGILLLSNEQHFSLQKYC